MENKRLPNEVSQLGSPLTEYRRSHVLFTSPLLLLIGGLFMAFILITGRAKDWEFWQILVGLAIGVGGIWGGVAGIRKFIRERGARILIFPEGLAEINDSQTSMIRWDEVKSVTISRTSDFSIQSFFNLFAQTLVFEVELKNGTKRTFTQEISNHKKLGETIRQETTKKLLPIAIEAFDKGQTVIFDSFAVSQQGFSHGNKTASWDKVKGFIIREDSVFMEGPAILIPDTTPNYSVLLELIDYARGNRS